MHLPMGILQNDKKKQSYYLVALKLNMNVLWHVNTQLCSWKTNPPQKHFVKCNVETQRNDLYRTNHVLQKRPHLTETITCKRKKPRDSEAATCYSAKK